MSKCLILVGVLDRDFYGDGEAVSCVQSLGQVESLQVVEVKVGRGAGLESTPQPSQALYLGQVIHSLTPEKLRPSMGLL